MYLKRSLSIALACSVCAIPTALQAQKKPKKKAGTRPKKIKIVQPTREHPFFALENIVLENKELLQIGGMAFHEGSLYVVTFAPDRTNKKPDHNGRLIRVDGVTENGKAELTVLCEGLYEPCAVGVVGKSIYVGTKDQILRFTDGIGKDKLEKAAATVVVDGTSTVNFHTYTVGFEPYVKDGKDYLCANFTTAIVPGGKRDRMIPANDKVNRGSTFIFGPLTGAEDPKSIEIEYLAGGYRTPNGIEVGPDNVAYVADNQGIFNPSNKLLRIEPGSFYGHYLYTDKGRAAAFQPKDVDPKTGDVTKMARPTLHLPQEVVAKSPAQPHVVHGRTGVLAPYNGQILLCDFTSGQILRASLEKVGDVWQGVVFQLISGPSDKDGNNGFTGGPNRLLEGPDGHYYVGQIGAGRLWEFNGAAAGLQRLRVNAADTVPESFNEILNVKATDGGFEIEFLKPIDPSAVTLKDISVTQWTYHPTPSYGGTQKGLIQWEPTSITVDKETGKKAILIVDGLKDGSDAFVEGKNSNANSGWVTHVVFDPKKDGKSILNTYEFWYTMHNKIGGKRPGKEILIGDKQKLEMKFKAVCAACHRENDVKWAAPNLKGIIGRKQTVIRNGKEVEVTVDEAYVLNAILNTESEKPKEFKDGAMPNLGLSEADAQELVDYIKTL